MAQREPTVVEQMTKAYLRARNISAGDLGAATPAMLAALRVLHLAFRDAGNEAGENSIFNVMASHERMRGD